MPDDLTSTRVEKLLPGVDVQVDRKIEIDPSNILGGSGFYFDSQGNRGEILDGTTEKHTVLYDLDVSACAGMALHPSGADLTARLREKEFNPHVAHLDDFGYYQEKFRTVRDEKIMQGVRLHNSHDIGWFYPDAVQSVTGTGKGPGNQGCYIAILFVFEINEKEVVLKIEKIELVDKMSFADSLTTPRVVIHDMGWDQMCDFIQVVHSLSQHYGDEEVLYPRYRSNLHHASTW